MDNKGQSLVIFVLLLPIIFIILSIIWELGNMQLQISQYENAIKDTIKYGLNHQNLENLKEKLDNLMSKNTDGNYQIETKNEIIKINLKTNYQSIYSEILHFSNIDITYIGYKENNKIIIKKE
ncbi:MAG: hypothetical protein PUA73_00520 [Bacilli bacterium]|nr:hypothetical protein [Bacilli bacterium]